MEKTKLGLPVGLTAAVLGLLCYYGGYVASAIVVGYVLLKEENEFLKKFILKVLVLMVTFSVLNTVIYFIPNVLGVVYSLIYIVNVDLYLSFVDRIFNFLGNALSVVKIVVFLLLCFNGLKSKMFKVPVLDEQIEKLLRKHIAE